MLELIKYDMLHRMVKSKPKNKKYRPRPKDPLELASLIGKIATGEIEDKPDPEPTPDELRRVMSALGKRGGAKGGKARSKALSPARRKEIAQKAAKTRWKHTK